jgi:hypothetical protein
VTDFGSVGAPDRGRGLGLGTSSRSLGTEVAEPSMGFSYMDYADIRVASLVLARCFRPHVDISRPYADIGIRSTVREASDT